MAEITDSVFSDLWTRRIKKAIPMTCSKVQWAVKKTHGWGTNIKNGANYPQEALVERRKLQYSSLKK